MSTLHSTCSPPHISASDADTVATQILTVLRTCSVRDNDLPMRGSVILETFWSVRHMLPKWDTPVGTWPDRIGATTSYWCLARFKHALQEARNNTDGAQGGIDVYGKLIHSFVLLFTFTYITTEAHLSNNDKSNDNNVDASLDTNPGQDQTIDNSVDLLQGVDWSMIVDDFGWIGEGPVFLGPA